MSKLIPRGRLWAGVSLSVILVGLASVGIPTIRKQILRTAGLALVANDRLEPADIVVVSLDSDSAGALEAADLIHSGMAPKAAIFSGTPDPAADEFMRRGVPYETAADRTMRQLRSLGLETIDQIPGSAAGTTDESRALVEWSSRQGFRSIILISSPDHSRRFRRVLHRSLKPDQTRVMVHPTTPRYGDFDPERWWESRAGVRVEIEEGEKLLVDLLLHPIS